jgi:hypothetical protein
MLKDQPVIKNKISVTLSDRGLELLDLLAKDLGMTRDKCLEFSIREAVLRHRPHLEKSNSNKIPRKHRDAYNLWDIR